MHRGRQLPCNQKRKEIKLNNPACERFARLFHFLESLPSTSSLSTSNSRNKNSPFPSLIALIIHTLEKKRNYFSTLFHLFHFFVTYPNIYEYSIFTKKPPYLSKHRKKLSLTAISTSRYIRSFLSFLAKVSTLS